MADAKASLGGANGEEGHVYFASSPFHYSSSKSMFGLECTELPRCGGYYGLSILLALILATLCSVHANTHPLAFALLVRVITQCELHTCAAPPGAQLAAAICIPNQVVRFVWERDQWEDAHL